MRNTYKKSERLHSKLLINNLFTEGESYFFHPFRITYLPIVRRQGPPVQILVSVSKRNFKSAVTRNKIKRLVRESYRNNKSIIWDYFKDRPSEQLLISMVYTGKTITPYSELERKLILILHSLIEKYESSSR